MSDLRLSPKGPLRGRPSHPGITLSVGLTLTPTQWPLPRFSGDKFSVRRSAGSAVGEGSEPLAPRAWGRSTESGCFRLFGRRWTPELSPHAHIFLFIPSAMRSLLRLTGFEVEQEGTFRGHYPWKELIAPWRDGDWKLGAWRLMQDARLRYSELIGSGPMLYALARRPAGES